MPRPDSSGSFPAHTIASNQDIQRSRFKETELSRCGIQENRNGETAIPRHSMEAFHPWEIVIPLRVRLAVLLAFVIHGILILAMRYRLSYDAYTHMFFADHYRLDWWSLWDPRWYSGFSVISYPPLVHQLIALIGKVTGVDAGYAIVFWVVLIAYPLAIYAFSRIFIAPKPAEYAALGAAILPSIYLAAYTFGQLPTLTGTLLALFCAAALAEFLKTGRRLSGALAVMLAATMMGAHHATLLFLPWLVFAIGLHLLLTRQVSWQIGSLRMAGFGILAVIAGLLVIWPFWHWGQQQAMQTPIDHATRHNYFSDPLAAFLFFWSVYGPLVAIIPWALWKMLDRKFFPLAMSFGVLFLLGLGGTTPLPRWLFGAGWAWLTYDRFAFWATLCLLPFLGMILTQLEGKNNVNGPPKWNLVRAYISCHRFLFAAFASLAGVSILVSLYPTLLPTQPKLVDMQPIVNYLAQGDRSHWRYLTFGFGDQFAYLNRLTQSTTIDGSYHTARKLPELRTSGLASIDSAYWLPNGLDALGLVLKSIGKYGVRWGFVDNPKYIPVLLQNGWVERTTLTNGIQVWEYPAAVLPAPNPAPADNPLASFSWGTLPLLALAITASLAGLRLRPAITEQVLEKIYITAIGLLPIGLVFWFYRPLTNITYPRVYFIYDNAFVFLSDAFAFIAVTTWALIRWFRNADSTAEKEGEKPFLLTSWSTSIVPWTFALCCLASLSIFWSEDSEVALYLSLHLWLGFGLFLSLRDRPAAWQAAMIGFSIALGIQIIAGFAEFAFQSTRILAQINMNWPGVLDPSMRGTSVVQLVDGTRWLRAYGTLPHPNILGTFIVALLFGPVTLFLLKQNARIWAFLLFSCGVILLILSFSRGAWIGFFISVLVVAWKSRDMDRKRLLRLGIGGAVSLIGAILPLQTLVMTRLTGAATVPTETFSIKGRDWLIGQALAVIQQRPVLGVGIGSFILNLQQHALPGYIIEPVHNLPLLVVSELGIVSAVILVGLVVPVTKHIWEAHQPKVVLISAALVGLAATSLFDHSLWTQAPGRILLAMVLGLWSGQVEQERR